MGFEKIYYQGKELKPDPNDVPGIAVLLARNRLHRWWLRLRNPGMTVYIGKWLKWRVILNEDVRQQQKNWSDHIEVRWSK